jgi:hypothetical protein
MDNGNGTSPANGFESLKADIDRRFPRGRFVAVEGGRIVADAKDLRTLVETLTALGKDPHEIMAVQAGVDYPHSAVNLAGGVGCLADE